MTQMDFYDAIKFFPNYSIEDKAYAYAILGGIVFPNISSLELDDAKGVYDLYIKTSLNHFSASAFENICIQYLQKMNIKNKLPFRFKTIGKWWDNKNEIDIIATDGEKIILGECKFKNSQVTVADYKNLKEKYNSDKKIFYYMFSKSGFNKELIDIAKKENINLISLKEMIND